MVSTAESPKDISRRESSVEVIHSLISSRFVVEIIIRLGELVAVKVSGTCAEFGSESVRERERVCVCVFVC